MTHHQVRVLAVLTALVVLVAGVPAALITWSATHRPPAALTSASTVAAADLEATPTSSTSPEQIDLAVRAATATATWSQSESAQARTERLQAVLTPLSAAAPTLWNTFYATVEGASVTVESTALPQVTWQGPDSVEMAVPVSFVLRRPGQGDLHDQGVWTVTVPSLITDQSRATVREPSAE